MNNKKEIIGPPFQDDPTPFVDPLTGKYFKPPKDSVIYEMDENGKFFPVGSAEDLTIEVNDPRKDNQ